MTRFALALASCLFLLAGCPKSVPDNVAGNDDEQMDKFGSQLEELRTRQNVTCDDACVLKDKVCGISAKSCEIANKHSDRSDFQQRCAQSMEDCAKFNDGCSGCKK